MELNTRDEKSLLLYFETQAVDYGGTLEGVRMNADDFAIAKPPRLSQLALRARRHVSR